MFAGQGYRVSISLNESDESAIEAVVRCDLAAPKISYQHSITKFTEIAGRPNDSPGGIQPVAMLETILQPAGWTVDIDKTIAWPSVVIMLGRVLLRVGYEQASTDVLDVEWRKPMWNT